MATQLDGVDPTAARKLLFSIAGLPGGPDRGAVERILHLLDEGPVGAVIDGEVVSASATFDLLDPSTGALLGSVSDCDAAVVDQAVDAAAQAFATYKRQSGASRGAVLRQMADVIEQNQELLAVAEALDTGRPLWEIRAADLPLVIAHFHYFAGWAGKEEGTTTGLSDPAIFHYSRREPLGVVGGIIPWNFPLVFAAYRIAAPLAFGNTVVLKPAEQASLSTLLLARLFADAGVPAGLLNVVPGQGATGAALVAHPGVEKIAFTGSVDTGRLVGREAANAIKQVSLELGGKSANIIFDDAPVDAAVAGALGGIFFAQGQVCTAGSRLFLHREIRDTVIDRLGQGMAGFVIGHALDPKTTVGPLVDANQQSRVQQYIDQAREAGLPVLHERKLDLDADLRGGFFVTPIIFGVDDPGVALWREEIFGPVLAVADFDDEHDVVTRANDTTFGLANGIWTNNLSRAHRVAAELESGTVWVNTYNMFDPAAPIGGFKSSGIGRELGSASVQLFTRGKSVWINTAV
ncbi:aldehyde dehydrogenase family protein [Pseudonocardia sp. NPDC049635]|uniref:aldehyde dehydrogenase family protein n=1 Tax=Pseudonocardia sp. NPDC049635 TaxID=3155506 RepID=UPI0033C26230